MNRRDFMKQSAMAGAATGLAPKVFGTQLSANERISIGVVGSGARAQQIMEATMVLPNAEIVAVCDAYEGRAKRAQARTGGRAKIVEDYKQIFGDPAIDVVVIGTPDHWHKTMAVEALAAGKDVYLEKPMTFNVDEGLEIIDAVKRHNRILQVGSQGISTQTEKLAQKMVQEGRLGKVTMIRASYNRNSAGGAWIYPIPPDASPQTINWDAFQGSAPKRPFSTERFFRWRCYWDYSGGIATDLFVHLVTSIHFIMGAKMPKSVVASGELYRWKESREVPDTVNAILVYPEGFTVNLSSTFNNQSSSEEGFEILGTEGSLSFRGGRLEFRPENVYEDNRWVVESWDASLEKEYYAKAAVKEQETPSTWKPQMKQDAEVYEEWGFDSTVTHMANLLDSVKTRQQPIEDALTGHRAASCAHMVNRSIRERKALEWDFSKERVKA